jgi:UDP-N-acetylglucosamine 2-epimerase (non-hydrolysing)
MSERVLVIIGTRPEAIKLAPLILALQQNSAFEVDVCLTSQHRDLVRPVLSFFHVPIDHDLGLGLAGQSPAQVTCRVVAGVSELLAASRYDQVIVQGDTSSALGGGLAALYQRVPLIHVEAGLRSGDLASPFPEEGHRRLLDVLAELLFVPTSEARENLLSEGVPSQRIHTVGNTGIDALFMARDLLQRQPQRVLEVKQHPLILLTAHRRENFGQPLRRILKAVRELVKRREGLRVLFPVHPNPQVRETAQELLGEVPEVHLCEPLDYAPFVQAMLDADLILTDSGGVQEEAATLGKHLLVLRETTERPEGVRAGLAELVGTDPDRILSRSLALLHRPRNHQEQISHLYGDGKSCQRIMEVLLGQHKEICKLVA